MRLVEDTRRATLRFADQAVAVANGYQFETPATMLWNRVVHNTNYFEISDERYLDPGHVESLLYGYTERHGIVLIGAMYVMPKVGMKGPEVGGCMTHWHSHELNDGTRSREMLHLWFVDMPGGRFAEMPDPEYIRNL